LGLDRYCDLDNHKVIDAIGVGIKYFHPKKIQDLENCDNFKLDKQESYEFGQNILKGVEIKVSRSDYKNGFICSGCNYHFILTPMRMVAPHEVPKGIGLIEFNRFKFSCLINPQRDEYPQSKPFLIKGLRLLKRPRFQHIPRFQIDNAIMEIVNRTQSIKHQSTLKKVEQDIESMTYQKPKNYQNSITPKALGRHPK
jgi:hypothetical protein